MNTSCMRCGLIKENGYAYMPCPRCGAPMLFDKFDISPPTKQ